MAINLCLEEFGMSLASVLNIEDIMQQYIWIYKPKHLKDTWKSTIFFLILLIQIEVGLYLIVGKKCVSYI